MNTRFAGNGQRTQLPSGITGQHTIPVFLITVSHAFSLFLLTAADNKPGGHLRHGLRVAPQAEKPFFDPNSRLRKDDTKRTKDSSSANEKA